MMSKDIDKDIVNNMINGDEAAFKSIYKQCFDELYYVALGSLREKELAEDIVQEAFIYLWRTREHISTEFSISAYLHKIVRNASMNLLRHQKVERRHQEEAIQFGDIATVEQDEIDDLIIEVRTALDQLPEKCRRVFILSAIEGLKYHEIAEDMDISINTVKSQIKIAYKKIRSNITHSDIELIAVIMLLKQL